MQWGGAMRDKYGFKMLDPDETVERIPTAVLNRKAEIEMMQAGSPENFVLSGQGGILHNPLKNYWFLDNDLAQEVILFEDMYWLFSDDECVGHFDSLQGMILALTDPDWGPWPESSCEPPSAPTPLPDCG